MEIETQHLPQDLITGILLRLPVKSLVRFKAVCKFWRSLISGPYFARSHYELATPRLALTTPHGIKTMDLAGSLHSNPISEKIPYDFLSTWYPIVIIGSCRGFLLLILLDGNDNLQLWNPSTRVGRTILSPSSSPVFTDGYPLLYGFWYDSSKDDYLVVVVFVEQRSSPSYLTHVQIFSLRANMWKYTKVTGFPRLTTFHYWTAGLLLNGAIHWLTYDGDESKNVILVFDLMEKRLLEIPVPDDLAHGRKSCGLWVHGSFLSLSMVSRNNTIHIWVMKKYRVQSSWTKTLVLSFSGDVLFPICSTKSGDIVMASSTNLVRYNDKGEQLEHRKYCKYLESQVPMYTESIFSLPTTRELSLTH